MTRNLTAMRRAVEVAALRRQFFTSLRAGDKDLADRYQLYIWARHRLSPRARTYYDIIRDRERMRGVL